MCLSEACPRPFRFFKRARDWKDHMQRMHSFNWPWEVHNCVWQCDADHTAIPVKLNQQEFDTKEAFTQHLFKAHATSLSRPQILVRSRRGKSLRIREAFTCPFCDCTPDEVAPYSVEKPYDLLARHIAKHLKAIAFLSLSHLDSVQYDHEASDSSKQGSEMSYNASEASVRDDDFHDIPQTEETVEGAVVVCDVSFTRPDLLEEAVVWPSLGEPGSFAPDPILERLQTAMLAQPGQPPDPCEQNPPYDSFLASRAMEISSYEPFDIQHVNSKFGETISPDLAGRLGKANSRRRQYFKYHERHHAKLSHGFELGEAENTAPNQTRRDTVSTVAPSVPIRAKYAQPTTSANQAVQVVVFDKVARTVVGRSETINDAEGVSSLVPPRPADSGWDSFECPFCFMVIKAANRRSWK